MVSESHSVECRHRLTLTSCGYERKLLGLEALYLVYVNENPLRNCHISKLKRRADDVEHASSGDGNSSSVCDACVYYLLNAVNV